MEHQGFWRSQTWWKKSLPCSSGISTTSPPEIGRCKNWRPSPMEFLTSLAYAYLWLEVVSRFQAALSPVVQYLWVFFSSARTFKFSVGGKKLRSAAPSQSPEGRQSGRGASWDRCEHEQWRRGFQNLRRSSEVHFRDRTLHRLGRNEEFLHPSTSGKTFQLR